jgi:hypothetical protein
LHLAPELVDIGAQFAHYKTNDCFSVMLSGSSVDRRNRAGAEQAHAVFSRASPREFLAHSLALRRAEPVVLEAS